MLSPVVVESYGSFWVVGVHPGEEDPTFDDVASKKSRGGWVRGRAKDCACGEDAFQAFFACVVVEDGGMGHLENTDSTPHDVCCATCWWGAEADGGIQRDGAAD